MLETYSNYIQDHFNKPAQEGRPHPGEHHFVSSYLVPRLFELNGRVPDYINPDGTKGIIGDVVYYSDKKHQFGIEVKLGTIRLTVNEFNNWMVETKSSKWPHTFIGVAKDGIAICSWRNFRKAYFSSVRKIYGRSWKPVRIPEGYGPMKSVNLLFKELDSEQFFPVASKHEEAVLLEKSFIQALRSEVDC